MRVDLTGFQNWIGALASRARGSASACAYALREFWLIWRYRLGARGAIACGVVLVLAGFLVVSAGWRSVTALADGFQGRRAPRAAPIQVVEEPVPELLGGRFGPHRTAALLDDGAFGPVAEASVAPPLTFSDDPDPWPRVMVLGGYGPPPTGTGGSGYTY